MSINYPFLRSSHCTQQHTYAGSPPDPNYLRLINKGSTWVQIRWNSLTCDGGYRVHSYEVLVERELLFFPSNVVSHVSNSDFTIHDLIPNTKYYIRVRTVSSISLRNSLSNILTVTTYPAGNEDICVEKLTPTPQFYPQALLHLKLFLRVSYAPHKSRLLGIHQS